VRVPSGGAHRLRTQTGMASLQQTKLRLSMKVKETSVAEESHGPAEGLPYASIVKGY
jgi:hypothetical protein